MTTVNVYKGDTVCYSDAVQGRTYIGSVMKSSHPTPDCLPGLPDLFDIDSTSSQEETSNQAVPAASGKQTSSNAKETQVHVKWTSLNTDEDYTSTSCPIPTVLSHDQLTVLERDHGLSDIVCHTKTGLVGSVVSSRSRAFVELLSYGFAMFNVDCSRFLSVLPWSSEKSENYVLWRGWLGRVVNRRSVAIVRFIDGARLLVPQGSLCNFEPIEPTTSALTDDPIFEGAWLRGEAVDLKCTGDHSTRHNRPNLSESVKRYWRSTVSPDAHLDDATSLPPNDPGRLRRELNRCSVTKSLMRKPDGMARVLNRLPLFLHETAERNASWFSRLCGTTNVSVFVECLIPVEATIHWLGGRHSCTERAPPTVVRGDELANLKSVHPYPHFFATTGDIWYMQLRESDVLYNLKAYGCTEELLYDWSTNNEDHLKAVRMQLSSSTLDMDSTQSLTDVPSDDKVSAVQINTPLWVQRILLLPNQRRYRVFDKGWMRLTRKELKRRARINPPRLHVFISEDDNDGPEGDENMKTSDKKPDSVKRNTPNKASRQQSSSEDSSDNETSTASNESDNRHLHKRESHLSPLYPGTWVAVGIHAVRTEHDVRWLNGTLERGIPSTDLRPLYFNLDEHEFFPGRQVSLKNVQPAQISRSTSTTAFEDSTTSSVQIPADTSDSPTLAVQQNSSDFWPRDNGYVVSVNPADRTCTVQWFRSEYSSDKRRNELMPFGQPEETGVYELCSVQSNHPDYGDLVWVNPQPGTETSIEHLVAFVEDIASAPGVATVRWPDGTTSEISRSELTFPLDSVQGGEHWFSDDDSDDFDSDELTSDYDSEWETVSENSASSTQEERKSSKVEPQADVSPEENVDSEFATVLPYDDAVQCASELLSQAYARTRAAHDIFQCHRNFVCWILNRFAFLPGVVHGPLFAMCTLLRAAAANSVDYPARTVTIAIAHRSEAPSVIHSRLVEPAAPLELSEESELWTAIEKLRSIRDLLHEAYNEMLDFRIKRLYRESDPRRLLSEEFLEDILSSVETDGDTTSRQPQLTVPSPKSETDGQPLPCDLPASSEAGDILHLRVLKPDEFDDPKQSDFKVLVIPDSAAAFLSNANHGWQNRMCFCVEAVDVVAPKIYYLLIRESLFDQVTHYLSVTRLGLLERLTGFRDRIVALLGEIAPDAISEGSSKVIRKETAAKEPSATSTVDICRERTISESSHDSPSRVSVEPIPLEQRGEFILEDAAPVSHHFYQKASDSLCKTFLKAWRRDTNLLSTSLPRGVIVKAFSDLLNLFSFLIVGPKGTPYEHGLLLFDVFLPPTYPTDPPQVHYYSFSAERINPNLYVDGNVCLSLLGTWAGKGSENWDPVESNLLQLVVSLQGLILNSEPFFNEAGFDACRGSAESAEASRTYNESAVVTLMQSTITLLQRPQPVFEQEIIAHFKSCAQDYAALLEFWASLDRDTFARLRSEAKVKLPEFPLAPVTRGFQLSVRRHRAIFLDLIASHSQEK